MSSNKVVFRKLLQIYVFIVTLLTLFKISATILPEDENGFLGHLEMQLYLSHSDEHFGYFGLKYYTVGQYIKTAVSINLM